ncbi:MAG: hypothetical protein ACR2P3_09035 [Geminicoccaceae bacterium]
MDVSVRAGLSIMAACMALAGCAGITDPAVGQGPIALSADAENAFVEYRTRRTPRYFAVSTDGQSFYYSYCDAGRCLRQPKTRVIEKCESYSNGVPCKIYASQGNVVWIDGT